jgi:predicted kinase
MPDQTAASRPALVIVTGPPASGKTTLAEHLAERLKLPFISKDTLKERLYETFGSREGVEDRIERAALAIMLAVVESTLRAGVSVLAESNFDADSDVAPFLDLNDRCDVRIVQVHMDRDTDELVETFVRRAESGDRHPGHGDDADDAAEVRAKVEAGFWAPLKIPGALITADVNDDEDAIAERVRAVLEN